MLGLVVSWLRIIIDLSFDFGLGDSDRMSLFCMKSVVFARRGSDFNPMIDLCSPWVSYFVGGTL